MKNQKYYTDIHIVEEHIKKAIYFLYYHGGHNLRYISDMILAIWNVRKSPDSLRKSLGSIKRHYELGHDLKFKIKYEEGKNDTR